MKQRKGKFTLGMKIASILSCIALVSVGFASWWIVQFPDPVEYKDGSFEVYAVDTKNVIIENFKATSTEKSIVFGRKDGVTEKWLISDSTDKAENLEVTFTFDVKLYDKYDKDNPTSNELTANGNLSKFVGNIKLDFAPTVKTNLDAAIEAQYITAPVITYSYGTSNTDKITYDPEDATKNVLDIKMNNATSNSQTVTLTVSFKWGEAFDTNGTADTNLDDNLNPYEFFNARKSTDTSGVDSKTWAEYAKTALDDIFKLKGETYKITLTAEVPEN